MLIFYIITVKWYFDHENLIWLLYTKNLQNVHRTDANRHSYTLLFQTSQTLYVAVWTLALYCPLNYFVWTVMEQKVLLLSGWRNWGEIPLFPLITQMANMKVSFHVHHNTMYYFSLIFSHCLFLTCIRSWSGFWQHFFHIISCSDWINKQ